MQILPQLASRAQSAATDAGQSGTVGLTSRQSALFASILDSARASSAVSAASAASAAVAPIESTTGADVSRVAAASSSAAGPSEQDLKTLPVTREDIAALRDDLKKQGFSDDEVSALEDEAGDGQSMTWGDLLGRVEKKVATTEKSGTKTVSSNDQSQLLGLFGKLGFTTEQSQQMIDALSKGETQSVWTSINTRLDELSGDESFHLAASELTTLGRAMNLSDEGQSRLAALFNQSGAEAGLSGQGIVTALGLVKNELLAQIGKENQAMADFRQASSGVLANAWQRETGKRNSDLHQDDVARKAGQIVAMSNEEGGKTASGSTGLNALADVPQAGKGVTEGQTLPTAEAGQSGQQGKAGQNGQAASGQAGQPAQTAPTVATAQPAQTAPTVATAQAAQTAPTVATAQAAQTASAAQASQDAKSVVVTQAVSVSSSATAELTGKAGAVAVEQAAWAAGDGESAATPQPSQAEAAQPGGAKTASAVTAGAAAQAANFSGGQQGATGNNAFGQGGQDSQDGLMAELLGKIRIGGKAGTAQAGQAADVASTTAAMDAVKTSAAGQPTKAYDPALAARVARQVETGILRNIGQEAKQLTVNLTPEELGPVQVTLSVKDKEVRAVITADSADAAAVLQEQAAKIKQHLEDQGFKVSKLDVQTGLAQDNQAAWDSPERHNEAREQREALERVRTSTRLAREAVGTSRDAMSVIPGAMTARAAGLDLFA